MITELTSNQNKLFKQWKKLSTRREREKTGLFLAEGKRLVQDALDSGAAQCCILAENIEPPQRTLPLYRVSERMFAELSQTEHGQGIAAVCAIPAPQPVRGDTLIVCDALSDPGNLGTIIRTAECGGADGVILLPGCVDPYSPKVVRSTMGSIFRMPIYNLERKDLLSFQKYDIVVTSLQQSDNLYHTTFSQKTMIVIGNEANGVSDEVMALANRRVKIPMRGRAESLNAAVAASVLLYERLRQREEASQ